MVMSMHPELGTVPDWIGAIGTTLAFFVAFVVLFLDVRERHRRQASQVAAWFDRSHSDVTLHVINASDAPVYNVQVMPQFLHQTYDVIRYPLMSPGQDDTPLQIKLPGSEQVSNEYLGVQMLFADSAGRRWKRLRAGKLKRQIFS